MIFVVGRVGREEHGMLVVIVALGAKIGIVKIRVGIMDLGISQKVGLRERERWQKLDIPR